MKLSILPVLGALLGGCAAPVVVGAAGAAGAGTAAAEERSLGTMVADERIEWKTRGAINRAGLAEDDHRNVKVTSFNRIVLLTGQVPDEETRQRAGAEAGAAARVRGVHNELVIGKPTTLGTRSVDTLITGRIKLALATSDKLPGPLRVNVKVVTEDGVVFLMGLMTREQSETVTAVVGTIPGVRQIVRLFEFSDAQPSAHRSSGVPAARAPPRTGPLEAAAPRRILRETRAFPRDPIPGPAHGRGDASPTRTSHRAS